MLVLRWRSPCQKVRSIVKLLHCFQHMLSNLWVDWSAAIDDVRDRRDRDLSFVCHITDSCHTFQEDQWAVAVRVNVALARISCEDAPTRTSNSPASATHSRARSS